MKGRRFLGIVARRARRVEWLVPAGAALCLVGLPTSGAAQGADVEVGVRIRVVSEGGGSVAGAAVRVTRLHGAGEDTVWAGRLGDESDVVSLALERGQGYRVTVDLAGHASRAVYLSPSEPSTLRLVLVVEPYDLPPIQAAVRDDMGEPRARSVFQSRFATESLTYATVGEWLRDVPGVSLRGRGPGGGQAVSVRGSRPEDVLVLLDGVPLNDPLTGRANLEAIPTATLQSGTLIHGAASQRYGSGAGAGVLLLTSRAGQGTGITGGIRMGSFGGMGFDLQGDASAGDRRLGVSLAAERAENDFSYRVEAEEQGTAEARSNADAAGLHGAVHGRSGPVFASFRFDRSERGVAGRAGSRLFDQARAEDRSWIAAAGIDLEGIHGSASYGSHGLDYRASPTDAVSAQQVQEWRLAGDVKIPATPATLGARVTREAVTGSAIQGAPVRTVAGGRIAVPVLLGSFQLDPAVSVDIAGGSAVTSPEIGVTWTPSGHARVWGRVGQGFRFPTFGDLYFSSRYQLRPNPDLGAERVTLDTELGLRLRAESNRLRLETAVSGWARRTEDPIVWLSSSAALWSPRNVGELWANGVEIVVDLESRGPGTAGWRSQVVAAWQQSRVGFGSNRNPLPYEPSRTGRLSLEGWTGRAGARVDVRYTGPRTTSLAATRSLDGFTTLDLSGRYQLVAGALQVALFGRVENLLDQRYQWSELYPEPGRQFTLRLEARRATP